MGFGPAQGLVASSVLPGSIIGSPFYIGATDLALYRDAANVLAQRNGTSAQEWRLYNTWTDASNNEYLAISWALSSNVISVGMKKNGGGTARSMSFLAGNASVALISIGTSAESLVLGYSGNTSGASNTSLVTLGGSGAGYTGTTNTVYGTRVLQSAIPSSSSTMVFHQVALTPTFNYAAGGAGRVDCLYIAPTNTALPTGNNGAIVLSSAAAGSTGLNGIQLYNTADETTNWERMALAWTSNLASIRVRAAGSGTQRNFGVLFSAGGGLAVKAATTTLSSVSGASVTATNLVPARAQVIGVATYVTVALGTSGGTTGYTVGDGSDADRFGAVTGTIVGTDTDSSSDATADPRMTWSTSAQNIVITAAGGNFDGTGTIRVEVYYLGDTAPTS